MTEKQQKAAFARQLKPAINAVKKFSKPKYASGFRVALTYLDSTINVRWVLSQSRHVRPFAVGSYAIAVPVPACVKLTGHIQAIGPTDAQKTLAAIVEAAQ